MQKIRKLWEALAVRWLLFKTDETGATSVEYALIAALIAAVVVTGATALGIAVNGKLQGVADVIVPPAP